mgnify:FL=1
MAISLCIKGREEMTKNIIIKTSVQKRFDSFMAHGRVLFFSAPCGFGKTVLADALLRGRNVLRQSAADPDCVIPPSAQDWDILLIDDLQFMQEEAGQQALCELIRSSPERHFVLLSRGVPPGCLTAFQYTGLMTVLEADDLLFDAGDVRRLFQLSGVNVTDSEIDGILKESLGYPLGVAITARCMSPNKPWAPELVARVFHEVFLYFETAIYRRFDLPVRRFLLELAPFESFDLEMARMVSGDPRAGERLDWILRYTTMLRYEDCQRFHFWSGFRAFLLWEMEREYTEEKRKALISRGGLYYELKEDYAHALECYTSGGDHSKVSELLVRNAELHPGMGHYAEMEKYYRSLPEAEILASPSLMQGMSMLCALVMDYEGSERWYGELQKFVEHCGRQDAAGKQARGRLAWLDISLPQRGVKGLTETIPAVFRLLTNKEVALPSFSVTSALPSIMNGGKDFSEWSKKDDLLYKTLRLPVEAVLGRDSVCLADCAIAESKFEKGEDVAGRMLSLLPQMNEIRNYGTSDMEFAVSGLLARSQLANGQPTDARRTIMVLRECFAERGLTRFLPNMDAMLCRIDMHTGDLDAADAWYREKAPCEPTHLNVMRRYQYLTQAMVELEDGRPDTAQLTLSPLEPYIQNCARNIDGIHLNVLTAIALRRKKDERWSERLTAALDAAAEYRFIRTVSVYGTAVLPLLEALDWDGDKAWRKRLMAAVRTQAAFYPHFLEPSLAPGEELTPTELQILHLLCADKPQPDSTSIKPYIKDDSGKEGWDVIKPQLEEAKAGDTVTVAMNGTTVVPKDVIDSIKGKDTTLVLDMGNGLSWKIYGKDITDAAGDIDFDVTVGADAGKSIPVDVINNVTGERSSMNLTLAYDGEFGFTATLTVNIESKNAGLYANLFYYNEQTGELEFISAGQIDPDGNVELVFTHASDYTIVVDTRIMSDNGQADNKADETIPASKTDDSTSKYTWNNTIIIIIGICIMLIVIGAIFYVRKKSGSEE